MSYSSYSSSVGHRSIFGWLSQRRDWTGVEWSGPSVAQREKRRGKRAKLWSIMCFSLARMKEQMWDEYTFFSLSRALVVVRSCPKKHRKRTNERITSLLLTLTTTTTTEKRTQSPLVFSPSSHLHQYNLKKMKKISIAQVVSGRQVKQSSWTNKPAMSVISRDCCFSLSLCFSLVHCFSFFFFFSLLSQSSA